jgi:hypothetical protein
LIHNVATRHHARVVGAVRVPVGGTGDRDAGRRARRMREHRPDGDRAADACYDPPLLVALVVTADDPSVSLTRWSRSSGLAGARRQLASAKPPTTNTSNHVQDRRRDLMTMVHSNATPAPPRRWCETFHGGRATTRRRLTDPARYRGRSRPRVTILRLDWARSCGSTVAWRHRKRYRCAPATQHIRRSGILHTYSPGVSGGRV